MADRALLHFGLTPKAGFFRSGFAGIFEFMNKLILKLRSLKETNAQDLIEYALMAGFVAVAAGAVMPNVAASISTIFSGGRIGYVGRFHAGQLRTSGTITACPCQQTSTAICLRLSRGIGHSEVKRAGDALTALISLHFGTRQAMADEFLFLTELYGLKVYDLKGRSLGRIKDAAIVPLVDPVRVDRFLIGGDGTLLTVRYDQVKTISLDGIHLRDENLTPYHSDEYMLRLTRDLLDQQIVDAQGRKVVRVNDVTFERRDDSVSQVLWVLEVDIGIRSIFRRLLRGILPSRWIRRLQRPHSSALHSLGVLQHSGSPIRSKSAAPEYFQPLA